MSQAISCCCMDCAACPQYPTTCPGCAANAGKAFWLAYTGEAVCGIFQCCVVEKRLPHCGRCPKLPCALYDGGDPTKTPEENKAVFLRQMERLKTLD